MKEERSYGKSRRCLTVLSGVRRNKGGVKDEGKGDMGGLMEASA